MKKLKLTMRELDSPEVLSRQQLKKVLGGIGVDVTTEASRCKQSPVTCELDGVTGVCETNRDNKCVCRTTTASMTDQNCVR